MEKPGRHHNQHHQFLIRQTNMVSLLTWCTETLCGVPAESRTESNGNTRQTQTEGCDKIPDPYTSRNINKPR